MNKKITDDNEQYFMAESFPFAPDATVPKMTYLEQSAQTRFGK
jgi:hypothetical protein